VVCDISLGLTRRWPHIAYTVANHSRFDRLWVVQEVVLAPTVMIFIGPVSLPLETFARAKSEHQSFKNWPYYGGFSHKSCERLLESGIAPFVEVARLRSQIRDRAESLTMLELRLQLSRRAATVDLDQIYSLLGVSDYMRTTDNAEGVPETRDPEQKPNYNQAPELLYKTITYRHIMDKLSLLPLSISSHKESHAETQSWVIDWTILQGSTLSFDQLLWTKVFPLFQADRHLGAALPAFTTQASLGLDILQLEGCFVDEIAVFTTFASLFDDDNAVMKRLREHEPESSYPGNEETTWSDAWFRSIMADTVTAQSRGQKIPQPHRLQDDEDEEGFKSRGAYILAAHNPWIADPSKRNCDMFDNQYGNGTSVWGRYRWYGNVPGHSPEVNRLREFREGMEAQVEDITRGRILFMTKNGYIGITNKCKKGDEIYIVGGGNMPIILEKDSQTSGTGGFGYSRVVSDCYLHGFMDGEHNARLARDHGGLRQLLVV
jgi:hypothetical protein